MSVAETMAKYALVDKYKDKLGVRFRRAEQPLRRKYNALVMLIIATAVFILFAGKQWTKQSVVTAPDEEDKWERTFPLSVTEVLALNYIEALQERDWARIFGMTQWMQERVEHIRIESGFEAAQQDIEAFYQQEKEDFFAVHVGPSLTEEGISDALLFPQGAIVRVVEVKEGLSRPILNKGQPVNMVVVDVKYPLSVTAPTLADERRIDELRASLYLTLDGKIIKASVRGNARVGSESVLYRRLTPSETRRIRRQAEKAASARQASSGWNSK